MRTIVYTILLILFAGQMTIAQNYAVRFFGNGTNDIDRIKILVEGSTQNPLKINVGGDFTIEFQMKANATDNPKGGNANSGANDDWTLGHVIVDRDIFGNGDNGDYGISLAGNRIAFGVNNGSSSYTLIGGTDVADGNWRHIAVTRNGTTGFMQLFIDGVSVASATTSVTGNVSYRDGRNLTTYNGNPVSVWVNEPYLVLGAEKHDYTWYYGDYDSPSYNGYLDELRISNTVRYTSSYTPTNRFTDDANTVALFHFDEGSGTDVGNTALTSLGAVSNGTMNVGGNPSGPLWVFRGLSWTGAEDSFWNNPDNWNPSTLPGIGDDVLINTAANQPVVNLSPSNPALCNALYVRSGAILTISPSSALTAAGTVSNAGTINIQSDATGTGSLIHSNADVPATVQRYIPKYNDIEDHMFHFLSAPVEAQAIRQEFVTNTPTAGHDFYSWDEVNYQWINSKDENGNWNSSFENNFIIGKGYMVAYPDNVTKNFTGELNSYLESTPLVINCTHTAGKGNGWNLLGNPFPSSIDWDVVGRGDGMDNALYYYDAAAQNYRYYIQLESIGSLGNGSRYIPPMQGFMVHAKATGTKTVTIHNGHRVHNGQDTWYKSNENAIVSLSMNVTNAQFSDELFIHFNSEAKTDFDGNFDALKLSSYNTLVPKFYTISKDNKKLAINGLPEITDGIEIPVYFEAGLIGQQSIIAEFSQITSEVFLVDQKVGTAQNLSQDPIYTFTSTEGDSPNRFLLKFSTVGIEESDTANNINAWVYNNTLYLNNQQEPAMVEVFDTMGRILFTKQITGAGLQRINLSLPSGVYLIRARNSGNTITIKAAFQ